MSIEALVSEIRRTLIIIDRGYALAQTTAQKMAIRKAREELTRALLQALEKKPNATSMRIEQLTRALKQKNDELEAEVKKRDIVRFIQLLTAAVQSALEALSTLTKP